MEDAHNASNEYDSLHNNQQQQQLCSHCTAEAEYDTEIVTNATTNKNGEQSNEQVSSNSIAISELLQQQLEVAATTATVIQFVTRRKSIHELCDNDDDPFIPHNSHNLNPPQLPPEYSLATAAATAVAAVAEENSLIAALGAEFIQSGAVPLDAVEEKIELVKHHFEDGAGLDEELVAAIAFEEHSLISFLLAVVNSQDLSSCSQDKVARCLAFAGNISSSLWPDYTQSQQKLLLLLRAARKAVIRVRDLLQLLQFHRCNSNINNSISSSSGRRKQQQQLSRGAYLGYDERDAADFNMQGYDSELQEQQQQQSADHFTSDCNTNTAAATNDVATSVEVVSIAADASNSSSSGVAAATDDVAAMLNLFGDNPEAAIEDCIMVWLLLLSQLFALQLPGIRSSIQFSRSKWNNITSSNNNNNNSSSSNYCNSELIFAELTEENTTDVDVEAADNLNEVDLVTYFRSLTEQLLLLASALPEAAYLLAVKAVAAVNSQFPPLKGSSSTEIADCFARMDSAESQSNLSQGLLHVLNENGYPELCSSETPAVVRLCIDLLHVEDFNNSSSSNHRYSRGSGGGGDCDSTVGSLNDSFTSSAPYAAETEPQLSSHTTTTITTAAVEAVTSTEAVAAAALPPPPPPPPPPLSSLVAATTTTAAGSRLSMTANSNRSSLRGSMSSVVATAYVRGHFYTNDIKVLVDILIRELRNIPHFSDSSTSLLCGALRLQYLRLFEAILTRSSWATSGDCYMKEHLKSILEEIAEKDSSDKSGEFAAELIRKYSYYID